MIQPTPDQLDALADCLAMLIQLVRARRQQNQNAVSGRVSDAQPDTATKAATQATRLAHFTTSSPAGQK